MKVNIIETINLNYCLKLANKIEIENKYSLEKKFEESLFKLWEVYQDAIRVGVVFSCCIEGHYTLDGYNEDGTFKTAIIAGKMACDEIFKFTSVIWTAHPIEMTRVTLLAKKIGFKQTDFLDNNIILKKEKLWE